MIPLIKPDFLPIKCDSCSNVFCKDHFKYDKHDCPGGLKDNQVPVCPLCCAIIPVAKGVLADIVVGQHIDNDCSDERSGSGKRRLRNKCSVKGCRQRELIPLLCSECKRNFCLRHRHSADHDCDPRAARIGTLDKANVSNGPSEGSKSNVSSSKSIGSKITNYFKPAVGNVASSVTSVSTNGGVDSDEALARALHESMNGSSLPLASNGRSSAGQVSSAGRVSSAGQVSAAGDRIPSTSSLSNVLSSVLPSKQVKAPRSQEEEDQMLAQAIANSERETQRGNKQDKCHVS